MRATAFILLVVGSLALPIFLLALVMRGAPRPYERIGPKVSAIPPSDRELADQFFPKVPVRPIEELAGAKPAASAEAVYPDSARAVVAAFADAFTAELALDSALESRPGFTLERRTHGLPYVRAAGKWKGGKASEILAWTEDAWLFWIEAPTAEALDARVADQVFVRPRPERASLARSLLKERFPVVVIAVLAYVLLLFPLWARAASWAASASPAPGAAPVAAAELERRLRALDVAGGPFAVHTENGEIVIEWRATEPAQLTALAEADRETLRRLRLELGAADRTVRARDESAVVEWSEAPGASPPTLSYASERSIMVFERRGDPPNIIRLEGGVPSVEREAAWGFDDRELKNSVVAVVNQSGWRFRPVLSFKSRLLFG